MYATFLHLGEKITRSFWEILVLCIPSLPREISAERKPHSKPLPFRTGGLQFCRHEVQTGLPESTPVPLGQITTRLRRFPGVRTPVPGGSYRPGATESEAPHLTRVSTLG